MPVIKSLKIEQDSDITLIRKTLFPIINNITNNNIIPLIESSIPGFYGGTGSQVSLDIAKEIAANFDIILAGGLTPLNVKSMIDYIKPWGVDVASGVESEKLQSSDKIIEFISNAKSGTNE